MKSTTENGFSLIELLLVIVILGILAVMAVPAYQKAQRSAENGSTFATMRTIASAQVGYYSQHGRFGTLSELNAIHGNGLGTEVDSKLIRGKFTFEMNPAVPSPEQLKNSYTISALRSQTAFDDIVYRYELTETGEIVQVLPL